MGIFDKFKKKTDHEKNHEPEPHLIQNQGMQTDDNLNEQFQGFGAIEDGRKREICNQFIAKAIHEFSDNCFNESTLDELSFDELCHVYSTIGWFVNKVAPRTKEVAVLYKKFLRKKLLLRLSTFPIYTIYATVSNLPFLLQDGSFLIYSDKRIAELTLQNTTYDWLEIHEITPETFDAAFGEYFCTGYKTVSINGKTKVNIEDMYQVQPIEHYGNICIEACTRMIDFKQTVAMLNARAKKENRDLNRTEIEQLNRQSFAVSGSLLKSALLVPAKVKDGDMQTISIPLVSFADGRKFIGLFTDQAAINKYYGKAVSCVSMPNLIMDEYKQSQNDSSVSGILINPGREEYMMTKEMLEQLHNQMKHC